MGVVILVVHIVKVVGENERQVEFVRQSQQVLDSAALDLKTVVHDFDEVVFFAEDVAHRRGDPFCFVVLAHADSRLNFATDTTTCCDEPLGVLRQDFEVHSRMTVETLDVGR